MKFPAKVPVLGLVRRLLQVTVFEIKSLTGVLDRRMFGAQEVSG
jgi:hypothetical protein